MVDNSLQSNPLASPRQVGPSTSRCSLNRDSDSFWRHEIIITVIQIHYACEDTQHVGDTPLSGLRYSPLDGTAPRFAVSHARQYCDWPDKT